MNEIKQNIESAYPDAPNINDTNRKYRRFSNKNTEFADKQKNPCEKCQQHSLNHYEYDLCLFSFNVDQIPIEEGQVESNAMIRILSRILQVRQNEKEKEKKLAIAKIEAKFSSEISFLEMEIKKRSEKAILKQCSLEVSSSF